MTRRAVRLLMTMLAVGLTSVTLGGCVVDLERRLVEGTVEEALEGPFYRVPDPLPVGEPGKLIRSEPIPSAPAGSTAWRVLYHSRDLDGGDIAVSGVVVAPDGEAPDAGRPIMSWAHPTTGSAQRCAPSVGIDPFDLIEGLTDFLAAGYVVAATDYPGMGAPGPSSFLLGVPEGNSVLDIAKVAREIPAAGANDRLVLWGHSQGGQAAFFAAEAALDYAPQLTLDAVAVAAPAADLGLLLTDDIADTSGITIGSYAFNSYEAAYRDRFPGLELTSILTDAGVEATPRMAELCLFGQHGEIHESAVALVGKYVRRDPSTTEPWSTMLEENSAGSRPVGVPILVAQGMKDTLVVPSATESFVQQLCANGEHVNYLTYPDQTHALIAVRAVRDVLPWMADLARGDPAPSECGGRIP